MGLTFVSARPCNEKPLCLHAYKDHLKEWNVYNFVPRAISSGGGLRDEVGGVDRSFSPI